MKNNRTFQRLGRILDRNTPGRSTVGNSLHPALQQALEPARRPAVDGRRPSQIGNLQQTIPSETERRARRSSQQPDLPSLSERQQRQSLSTGLDNARRLSSTPQAMQERRLSQAKALNAAPVKPGTYSVASSAAASSTAASSVSASSVRRASKVPHHDPEIHFFHQPGAARDFPRPFYSFVSSCNHLLDKLEKHIVPDSMHDMDLRDIRGCLARNGQIQQIQYCYGKFTTMGWQSWNIKEIEDQHEDWYWKIQQDLLQLYNDYHRMEYPEHYKPATWADVAHRINDRQVSRMEEFIKDHCVLQILKVGGLKQPIVWTNAHLRRIAEKKHGRPGLPVQQLKVKGSSYLITIHVDETLRREHKNSMVMIRHNSINGVNRPPALPSMHHHFQLPAPSWYHDHRALFGEDTRPRIEDRRRSRLAIKEGSQVSRN